MNRTRTRVRALVLGSAGLLLSCTIPTRPCACPPALAHGIVYGTVMTAAGDPVPGAHVQGTAFHAVCGGSFGEPFPYAAPERTGPDGGYRLELRTPYGTGAACVRMTAQAPDLSETVQVDAALLLRHERERPDSILIDLVLP